jgi:hypothetical protein
MTAAHHVARAAALGGLVLALAPAAAAADSLSCGAGIVSTGDSKLDVLAKCGRPSLREAAVEERVVDVPTGAARRVVAPVERWTYDLGRSRFIQVITLSRGKVVGFERGGYGFAEREPERERPRRATCDPGAIAAGKLAYELVAQCGEPAVVEAWVEELGVQPADLGPAEGVATVRVEVWTYDFGPRHLLRFARIVAGKVADVETGSHGYAE